MRSIKNGVRALALGATLLMLSNPADAQEAVRIGLGAPTLSFLPIWAARALDTFKPQGLTATVTALPGGDASALAALDSGDIDLAAVGTDAVLRAVAKGLPFQMVYTLMSKVTLQLVVSPAFLKQAGVTTTDPLPKRLGALKGAIVGVTSLSGVQESAVRWLAAKGALNPKTDIKVAQVGSPVAVQAALEVGRIDAFVLSAPEGYNAEKAGTGVVLVSLGDEFPLLADQPYLVFVAKKPVEARATDLITKTFRAMQAASRAASGMPEETAIAIQKKFFTKSDPASILVAVKAMTSGVAGGGRLDAGSVGNALTFAEEVGAAYGKGIDAKASENDLWTDRFVKAAQAN